MRTRTLPGTDLTVSEVCLGTMTWGEQNTEAQAHEQLALAREQGINFIDTAEMYPVPPNARSQGATETILGNWLAHQPRDSVVIATKVVGPGRRDWIRDGRTDLNRANIAEAVDASLRRLRTDHIDLYQIHWPQRNVAIFGNTAFDPTQEREGPSIAEQVEAMGAMLRAGKIRHWGLSNETAWGLSAFHRAAQALGVPGPVTTQNSYNLISRGADGDMAEALYREGMSLLAYSPLAGGMLSGKYAQGARPEGSRFARFEHLGARYRTPIATEAMQAWLALAQARRLSLVTLALGWVRSRWFVGATIIGATSLAQLRENILAAQTELDAETLSAIQALHIRYPNPAG